VVFLWQLSLGASGQAAITALGFTPGVFFGTLQLPADQTWVPPSATFITYLFLHGGWLHLSSNVLYLWIFADNVEDALGHVKFIIFYLLSGIAAALLQSLPDTTVAAPMVGASGGISGVLGAYLLLFPRSRINVLVPIFIVLDVVRLPAWVVLAFWFIVQLLYELAGPDVGGSVAFRAHIGGFIAGMVMTPFLVRPSRIWRATAAHQ
jgi:membrane associated rhomboid family serine protease